MSDHSTDTQSSRAISLGRAIVAGIALLATGVTLGVLVGQTSAPTQASAPKAPAREEADLVNTATDAAPPLGRGQLSDLMRGSQERDSSLQTTAPLEIGQPLQRTGPINGQMLAAAGAMPLLPRDTAWTELNDRVAGVLANGVPTREALEQLVGLVNDTPASSPVVQAGGPGPSPIASPTPLPPPVYESTNKASPN